MNFSNLLLTLVTFAPLVGVLAILFIPKERESAIRWVAMVASVATFAISMVLLAQFDRTSAALQMVERRSWFSLAGT